MGVVLDGLGIRLELKWLVRVKISIMRYKLDLFCLH